MMSETKSKARTYKGEKISVSYDAQLCMHAAKCVSSGLKKVFDKNARPWVNPDGSSSERIIDVIERCPSGALSYDFVQQELAETNQISPQPKGALYLRGDLNLKDAAGKVSKAMRLALCRCGHSKNKPYCDYSHHDVKFEDAGELGNSKLGTAIINTETQLDITPSKNGPLLIQGAFSLSKADNTELYYGEKTALCRCGQSKNKPFCDGSHNSVGFEA